jgi:poly(A) polymerase
MDNLLDRIQTKGISIFLESYSALDRYFEVKEPGPVHLLTDASLVSVAKIFDDIEYRGLPFEDACIIDKSQRYTVRCVDSIEEVPPHPFTAQHLIYSMDRGSFLDPGGIYWDLRSKKLVEADNSLSSWIAVMEAAKLVSRYHYELDLPISGLLDDVYEPSVEMQRELLIDILSSRYSEKGLFLLDRMGFIERFWPEIHEMKKAEHSKEYHPEGDVWEHTLESLRYRKNRDLKLSMALLLHDIGKPVSQKLKDKPFKDHAELGSRITSSFLRFLGFRGEFIRDVCFLVRYHMIPAALKKLPLYRTEKLMDSKLFPDLLELYRADLSSTFRGPESYYEACRIFKTYIKKRDNPYAVLNRAKRIL